MLDVTPTPLQRLLRERRRGYSLPAPFHLSPEIFEADMEMIVGRHWLYVGVEPDVPEAGDVMVVDIGKTSVAIVRDDDNEIRAFHNVCRHRGPPRRPAARARPQRRRRPRDPPARRRRCHDNCFGEASGGDEAGAVGATPETAPVGAGSWSWPVAYAARTTSAGPASGWRPDGRRPPPSCGSSERRAGGDGRSYAASSSPWPRRQ